MARKAKSCTWGLYLADARNQAEDLRFKREAAEKRRIDGEIAWKREQAAEAAIIAELDQVMPLVQAYGRIQVRIREQGRGIPPVLKARLERTGELISPNALEAAICGWKRCPECQGRAHKERLRPDPPLETAFWEIAPDLTPPRQVDGSRPLLTCAGQPDRSSLGPYR